MKTSLLIYLALLFCSCQLETYNSNTENTIAHIKTTKNSSTIFIPQNPFKLNFTIENLKNESDKSIELTFDIHKESFFIPHQVQGLFKGKFAIHFDESDDFTFKNSTLYKPDYVTASYPFPFVKGNDIWVPLDTKYRYPLEVHTKNDFKVMGYVDFAIEPHCPIERRFITLIQKEGVLSIELQKEGC